MVKKILIVVPPLVNRDDDKTQMVDRPDFEAYRLVSPIEPTQAAAELRREGFAVKIFDLGIYKTGGLRQLEVALRNLCPDAVVVVQSILTFATAQDFDGSTVFNVVRSVAKEEKFSRVPITVLTGCHATNYPGKSVADGNCDYSIRGEVEFELGKLFNAINSGVGMQSVAGVSFRTNDGPLFNSPDYPKVDVAQFSLPAYDLFSKSELAAYYELPEFAKIRFPEKSRKYRDIMTSRSCILRCTFCSVAHLRGETQSYRKKPLENVMLEIEQALDQGVEEIHFFDDLFVQNEKQILEFCNEVARRNLKFHWFVAQGQPMWPLTWDGLNAMKDIGMYRVICPLESGNNRVLRKVVGKPTSVEKNHEILGWLRKLELEVIGMFVVGMPGESGEEILDTIRFAESHPEIDYSVFSIATPMVGTKLMKQVTEKGLLKDQDSINKVIKRTVALYRTEEFNQVAMGIIRYYEWDRINFSTQARREKYARMVGISMAQLDTVRKYSRDTFEFFFPEYDGPRSYAELVESFRVKEKLDGPRIAT